MRLLDLPLRSIRTDGGTQLRPRMDPETIAEYSRLLREGVVLPPVEVIQEGDNFWLWDGFHRLYATSDAEQLTIKARVEDGTQRDAQEKALGANDRHGLKRDSATIRNAVILADALHPDESNVLLSQRCGVSGDTVAKYRPKPAFDASKAEPPTRLGADGKRYPATIYQPPRPSRPFEQETGPAAQIDFDGTGYRWETWDERAARGMREDGAPTSHVADEADAARRAAFARMERFVRGARDLNTVDHWTEAASVWGEDVLPDDAEAALDILLALADKCRDIVRLVRDAQQKPKQIRRVK